MKLLAKVEQVFTIRGRGVVVVPDWLSDFRVKVGDPIQLKRSGGQTTDTQIAGVEFMKQQSGGSRLAFMLPGDIEKEETPAGTEIWVSDVTSRR